MMRINNKSVNPLIVKLPRGRSIPKKLMANFRNFKNEMDVKLASIKPSVFVFAEKRN